MQFSWILFVKQIFNECGFSNIWETELFDNVDYLKCVIKQRLEVGIYLIHNIHLRFSLGMFCHRPVSMGSLLFVVLNLQSKIASFISEIFKYSSYLNSVFLNLCQVKENQY
jgi:hypothetical protein